MPEKEPTRDVLIKQLEDLEAIIKNLKTNKNVDSGTLEDLENKRKDLRKQLGLEEE